MGNIVARRYARALFALGLEQGDKELQAYGDDLASIGDLLQGSPELVRIFRNPIISEEEKKGVLKKLLERINPNKVVTNFCYLLADKNRLDQLAEIQAYYAQLLDQHQGILRGEVVTAIKLADNLKQNIASKLEEQSGQQVVLDYKVDQEIVGGLVLKVGDKVLDASLRAQLQNLKENIKRGE